MCGDRTTFSSVRSECPLGRGSMSKTSRAAPAISLPHQTLALPNCHDGAKHGRHDPLLAVLHSKDITRAHADGAPGFGHACPGDHPVALSRREEIHLVLDGQDRGVGRHQAVGRIATGAVGDGRDDSGVQKSVLLREVLAEGQHDLHLSRGDPSQAGPDDLHDPLPGKAPSHPGLERRILHLERRHKHCSTSRVPAIRLAHARVPVPAARSKKNRLMSVETGVAPSWRSRVVTCPRWYVPWFTTCARLWTSGSACWFPAMSRYVNGRASRSSDTVSRKAQRSPSTAENRARRLATLGKSAAGSPLEGDSPCQRRSQIHSAPSMCASVSRTDGKLFPRSRRNCSAGRDSTAPRTRVLAQAL